MCKTLGRLGYIEVTCWNVISHKVSPSGSYPIIYINDKKMPASRYAYCYFNNIPFESIQDKFVLHTCDNPKCVNPAHLMLGDHQLNMKHKVERGRQMKGETHGMAKLKEDQVREIRASKLTVRALAKVYNVGHSTIGQIKKGNTWKCLPD